MSQNGVPIVLMMHLYGARARASYASIISTIGTSCWFKGPGGVKDLRKATKEGIEHGSGLADHAWDRCISLLLEATL